MHREMTAFEQGQLLEIQLQDHLKRRQVRVAFLGWSGQRPNSSLEHRHGLQLLGDTLQRPFVIIGKPSATKVWGRSWSDGPKVNVGHFHSTFDVVGRHLGYELMQTITSTGKPIGIITFLDHLVEQLNIRFPQKRE